MYTDPLDHAAELQDVANTEALKRVRVAGAPEQEQNEDGSWPRHECKDCGEPIEQVRLHHGKVRCFECQSELEFRSKLRRF